MKLTIALVGAAFLAAAATGAQEGSRGGSTPRRSWDPEAAAKYLDDRMDAWFANAKKLRTGQTETTCISCHTAVPYVLARPVLRGAMGGAPRTPQELKLLSDTTRRVETYATHQLFYETNEQKKLESRGTEAVLNFLILASEDAREGRRHPTDATRMAMSRLWETQRPDGAWDWLAFGLEPWESADAPYHGATLAALALGYVPGLSAAATADVAARLQQLRSYLKAGYTAQNVLNRTWALLASTRFGDWLTGEQRDTLIADISNRQRDDGGWALETLGPWKWGRAAQPFAAPGSVDRALLATSDGYATGVIVYALRQAGVSAHHPAVARGMRWLETNQASVRVEQQAWSAWRAHSLNFDREHGGEKGEPWRRLFMSDAATAFAVLALLSGD